MKPFSEEARYDYPLTKDSIVLDIGAYEGNWGIEINRRYGCMVWMFEPCVEFANNIRKRITNNPSIRVVNVAVDSICAWVPNGLKINGDSTGFLNPNPVSVQTCEVIGARHIIEMLGPVELLKINAESAEYGILKSLVATGYINLVRRIQVQFHTVIPKFEQELKALQESLTQTHNMTFFDEPSLWQGWELKW